MTEQTPDLDPSEVTDPNIDVDDPNAAAADDDENPDELAGEDVDDDELDDELDDDQAEDQPGAGEETSGA